MQQKAACCCAAHLFSPPCARPLRTATSAMTGLRPWLCVSLACAAWPRSSQSTAWATASGGWPTGRRRGRPTLTPATWRTSASSSCRDRRGHQLPAAQAIAATSCSHRQRAPCGAPCHTTLVAATALISVLELANQQAANPAHPTLPHAKGVGQGCELSLGQSSDPSILHCSAQSVCKSVLFAVPSQPACSRVVLPFPHLTNPLNHAQCCRSLRRSPCQASASFLFLHAGPPPTCTLVAQQPKRVLQHPLIPRPARSRCCVAITRGACSRAIPASAPPAAFVANDRNPRAQQPLGQQTASLLVVLLAFCLLSGILCPHGLGTLGKPAPVRHATEHMTGAKRHSCAPALCLLAALPDCISPYLSLARCAPCPHELWS